MANPTIGGPLNFGSVPAMGDYQSAYSNALELNKQLYSQILSGYQGLSQSQAAAQQAIQQGYGNLSSDVLGDIQGIDASQRQALADAYQQQQGSAAQGLISRGLGNTTVANSVQRGLALDKAKADIALSNQTAQLRAGYRSNLGLAGLNYANQANTQNTALGSQQLGWMNSINAPYPNVDSYARLAQMQGALSARNKGLGALGAGAGGGGFQVSGGSRGSAFGGRIDPVAAPSYTPRGMPSPYQQAVGGRPQTMDFGNEPGQENNDSDPYGMFGPQQNSDWSQQFPGATPAQPSYADSGAPPIDENAYPEGVGNWANQPQNFAFNAPGSANYGPVPPPEPDWSSYNTFLNAETPGGF